MRLSGKAAVAGVMGWPVAHSRSPRLHGYWLEAYGIDGAYVPFAVAPGRLEAALRGLAALGLKGCNVTLPHKEAVLGLADSVDDTARRIGAANTVIVRGDGGLAVTNTDAFGFIENLEARAPGWPRERPAVLLGAGGASRAAIVAMLDAGVPQIRIANRTAERAAMLADFFGPAVLPVPWEERAAALDGAGLLVNGTQLGMAGQPSLEIALDGPSGDAVVYDLVYVPLQTALLRAAAGRRLRCVDGLGMLLHQARPGFAAWFGREPEVTAPLYAHLAEGL